MVGCVKRMEGLVLQQTEQLILIGGNTVSANGDQCKIGIIKQTLVMAVVEEGSPGVLFCLPDWRILI